jgi:hypothetical protein
MGIVNSKEREMYIAMMEHSEQEQIVRALRGWEFVRTNHGSLFDRGAADSYYGRAPDPHYGGVGGDSGIRVKVMYAEAVAEYMAGYEDNERFGSKKDYR